MSHELRPPLNAIMGYSQLILLDKDTRPETGQDVGKILITSRHLDALISDIFDMAKIENRKLPLVPEAFILEELIEETAEMLRTAIESSGNHLSLRQTSTVFPVVTDRRRLCLLHETNKSQPPFPPQSTGTGSLPGRYESLLSDHDLSMESQTWSY